MAKVTGLVQRNQVWRTRLPVDGKDTWISLRTKDQREAMVKFTELTENIGKERYSVVLPKK